MNHIGYTPHAQRLQDKFVTPIFAAQGKERAMRAYYPITLEEMDTFLRHRGFTPLVLPNVKETVYGKIIDKDVCVRVYTGIVRGESRPLGADAIRVCTVKRLQYGKIVPIASKVSRVYRLENWKQSLTTRIDNVIDFYYDTYGKKTKAAI